MARDIRIKKRVFNQNQFDNVVDREFKSFKKLEPAVETDTIEEFFRLYDKLYYTIPIEGEDESHQYLIQESSKLINFEQTNDDIQLLLDEITQLRQELVDANSIINDLETEIASNGG